MTRRMTAVPTRRAAVALLAAALLLAAPLTATAKTAAKPKPKPAPTTTVKPPPDLKAKVITASPFDPRQVRAISKFRSCVGHDYSGHFADGTPERNRSMKHYVWPVADALTAPGKVKVFAPFDGVVALVMAEEHPIGKQVLINTKDGNWQVRLFHIDPVVIKGSTVKAGQLVGTGAFEPQAFTRSDATQFASIDIALNAQFTTARILDGAWDSAFAHLAPPVAAAWAARGVNPTSAVIPKATRDAAPCTFQGVAPSDQLVLTPL